MREFTKSGLDIVLKEHLARSSSCNEITQVHSGGHLATSKPTIIKNVLRPIRPISRRCGFDIVRSGAVGDVPPNVREEFKHLQFAGAGIQKLLDYFSFDTVLDIGCGAGEQAEVFLKHGKHVTALDYGKSIYFEKNQHRIQTVIGDFNKLHFDRQFDCVWASSHILNTS